MKYDPKVTEAMQAHFAAEESERDYAAANDLLLTVSGNKIRHRQFAREPRRYARNIDYQLKGFLEYRLKRVTHEQVREMKEKSDAIAAAIPARTDEIKTGKRSDHPSLPEEIRSQYIEALDLLNRERELHMQIRNIANSRVTCPDSELYPWVKEMIRLDKRRLQCWRNYDTYKTPTNNAEGTSVNGS